MNMTPEMKKAWDDHVDTIEKGRKEALDKIEALGKEAGDTKSTVAKMAADLEAKHAKYDETLAKLKAEMNRIPNAAESKEVQLKKEVIAIVESMRDNNSKGIEDLGKFLQSKGLSVADGTQAGVMVRPQFEQMITATLTERSMFRQNAQVITISNSDHIERPVNQKGGVGASRDGETESAAREDTGAPSVTEQKIFANWMRASVNVTSQLLDDTAENIAAWIQTEAVDDFATREDAEWFLGRGTGRNVNEARGIITFPSGTAYGQIEQVNSGAAAAFRTDGLLALQGSLKSGYRSGAGFYASRATIYQYLLTLKDAEDRHYLVPDFSAGGAGLRLLGDPIYDSPFMPSVQAGALALVYANLKRGYTIVDRQGLALLRDPFTAYPKIKFRYAKRTGGDVSVFEAIKIQKISA